MRERTKNEHDFIFERNGGGGNAAMPGGGCERRGL